MQIITRLTFIMILILSALLDKMQLQATHWFKEKTFCLGITMPIFLVHCFLVCSMVKLYATVKVFVFPVVVVLSVSVAIEIVKVHVSARHSQLLPYTTLHSTPSRLRYPATCFSLIITTEMLERNLV